MQIIRNIQWSCADAARSSSSKILALAICFVVLASSAIRCCSLGTATPAYHLKTALQSCQPAWVPEKSLGFPTALCPLRDMLVLAPPIDAGRSSTRSAHFLSECRNLACFLLSALCQLSLQVRVLPGQSFHGSRELLLRCSDAFVRHVHLSRCCSTFWRHNTNSSKILGFTRSPSADPCSHSSRQTADRAQFADRVSSATMKHESLWWRAVPLTLLRRFEMKERLTAERNKSIQSACKRKQRCAVKELTTETRKERL